MLLFKNNQSLGAGLDSCLRTGATANACLLELRNRKFPGCDADITFMMTLMPTLLRMFAEMMNPGSCIEEGEHVQNEVTDVLRSSTCPVDSKNIRQLPRGMCTIQPFPNKITLYISQYLSDMEFYENSGRFSFSLWSEKWMSCLNNLDE